jgi:hypothetical protein
MATEERRLNRRQALAGGGVIGAGALAALIPTIPAAADEERSASLVGAWQLAFAISGGPTLVVLEIFTGGGEVVGVSSTPPSSASAALGAWLRAGDDTYLNTHEFFQFDSAGNLTGTTRIRARVTVNGNQLSGQADIDFRPANSTSFIPNVGTATISGSRITPMPLS